MLLTRPEGGDCVVPEARGLLPLCSPACPLPRGSAWGTSLSCLLHSQPAPRVLLPGKSACRQPVLDDLELEALFLAMAVSGSPCSQGPVAVAGGLCSPHPPGGRTRRGH